MRTRRSNLITHVVVRTKTPSASFGQLGPGLGELRGSKAVGLMAYSYQGNSITVGERRSIPDAAKRIPRLSAASWPCSNVPYHLAAFTGYRLELTLSGILAIPIWHKPHGRLLGFWLEVPLDWEKLARWIEKNAELIRSARAEANRLVNDCIERRRNERREEIFNG